MTSRTPVQLEIGATQPTAAAQPIAFAAPEFGVLDTQDNFCWNATESCMVIPVLAATPATSPAANMFFFYAVLTGGNVTLRIKNSAGTVVATANLA